MNEDNVESLSGRYDLTFNIMVLKKQKLYNVENVEIETIGDNTLKLIVAGAI